MNRNSILDYWACILLKVCGPLIRMLPLEAGLFLGRRLGDLFYYLDPRHRRIAYANIKAALGAKLSLAEIRKLTRSFYHSFGQNLIEMFYIPLVDNRYIEKYITIQGREYAEGALEKGKGVIMVSVHAGSWELSNIICSNLGFPFRLFVRGQRYPRLNRLLNSYRTQRGCRLIEKGDQTRELIRTLHDNQAVGLTADQGGEDGVQVKFFGRPASMPSGAVRLALKYDAALVPVFYTRTKGPYIKLIIRPPFELKRSGDLNRDIEENLQALVNIFEKLIEEYPREYLWSYKIWKRSRQRNILVLGDGKAGHFKQAQAVAGILSRELSDRGIRADIQALEVKFKNRLMRLGLSFCALLSGKYRGQGRLCCLKAALREDSFRELAARSPNIIISCGSSLAAVNFFVSRENCARSVVIMRPSILPLAKFDLVLASQHDRPAKRKNLAVLEGALNFIDRDELGSQAAELKKQLNLDKEPVIGLLIGGDSKHFRLKPELVRQVIAGLKKSLESSDGQALISTSRRTSPEVEALLKSECAGYERIRLLVIANEKNIPGGASGILGLSRIAVVSPESISMVSEAVYSGSYVVVFQAPGLSRKHRRFLKHFSANKYLYLADPRELAKTIEAIYREHPAVRIPEDRLKVAGALSAII